MKKLISDRFDQKINELFSERPEIKRFILNHDRKQVCIENLNRELWKLENTSVRTNINSLTLAIDSFAEMFARAALLSKEQELMSKTEQIRQEREFAETKRLQEELENGSDASVDQFSA